MHFAYDDDDAHVRHQVWFLDAVTVLNQMRAARALGMQTLRAVAARVGRQLAVEDLGSSAAVDPVKELAQVEPGYDVDTEGEGDILRVTRKPQVGASRGDDGR